MRNIYTPFPQMATIIARLRDYALGAIGLESIDHGPADLTARILLDANRAVQEISVFVDDSFHYREGRGTYVEPFVSTTATVTRGSNNITLTTSAAWMNGCTCLVAGLENRLRKTNAGAFELARPYLGTTGTGISITIWHDLVALPTDVRRIEQPVRFDADFMQPETVQNLQWDQAMTRSVGRPSRYAETSIHAGDADAPGLALLLNQLPAGGSEIRFTAIGSIRNFADLNDTREHVVPFDLEASCLMPIFAYYFSSYRLSVENKQDITTDYQLARQALQRIPRNSTNPTTLKRPKR